tara:strand:+ start:8340 stop:9320 length:981 start_codon:yes stop_codon:yes gene_type:complete
MINYNIGIQLTKNSEKYSGLISDLRSKKNVNCIHIYNNDILKENFSSLDILATHKMDDNLFSYATDRLKWIHFGSAGIEGSLFPAILKSKTIITNSSGIHADSVSEFVIASMLYFAKQFKDCNTFYQNKEWNQWDIAKKMQNLKGKTIGIIGYGSIGKAIGKKAKVFGMRVIGTRRLQKKIENKKTIDYLIPISEIDFLLKESDYVIVSCPLTPLTQGLIGKNELGKMKKTSYLINIARGSIINENVLIEKLNKKHIAGAALDVFESEPLSNKSQLFKLDNVLLSPHISGNFPNYNKMVMELFCDNFNRFNNGKTLKNRVCKKRLY